MLKRLGYHEIVSNFTMSFRREAHRLVVEFGADVEDMYDVDVELTLDGLVDPTAMVRGVRPLLVGGRLDYVDHSLNDRIMKHCAEQQVTPEDVLAVQLREAHELAREAGMELDELIIQPYTDFLLGKQRFTLISQPPRPDRPHALEPLQAERRAEPAESDGRSRLARARPRTRVGSSYRPAAHVVRASFAPASRFRMFAAKRHPLLVPDDGSFDVGKAPTSPGKPKRDWKALLSKEVEALGDSQYRLYADGRYAVLLVFQALDAAGKDSTIRRVFAGVNPCGLQVASFKEPSKRELAHDFLWRTTRSCPSAAVSRSSIAATTRRCSSSACTRSSRRAEATGRSRRRRSGPIGCARSSTTSGIWRSRAP